MQKYSNDTRLVLEHIGKSELGDEAPVLEKFTGYGVCEVLRYNGCVDYVAVKWDNSIAHPCAVFDPSSRNGGIMKYEKMYVYDKIKTPAVDVIITPPSVKDPKTMKEDEIKIELLYVHGLTEEQYSELSNLANRKAKVAELRLSKNE